MCLGSAVPITPVLHSGMELQEDQAFIQLLSLGVGLELEPRSWGFAASPLASVANIFCPFYPKNDIAYDGEH